MAGRSPQIWDGERPGDVSELEEARDGGRSQVCVPTRAPAFPVACGWVGRTEARAWVFTRPRRRTARVPRPRGRLWCVLLRLEEERCHCVSLQRSCGQRWRLLLPPTPHLLPSLGGRRRHLCGNPEGSPPGRPGKERHPAVCLQHFLPEPRRIHRVGQAAHDSHGEEPREVGNGRSRGAALVSGGRRVLFDE